jgi:hypothetical protein
MRHDTDIPATIQRYGASHGNSSLRALPARGFLGSEDPDIRTLASQSIVLPGLKSLGFR